MKLLSTSLDQIGNEEKLCEIAKALGRQIETLYTQNSDEKVEEYKRLKIYSNLFFLIFNFYLAFCIQMHGIDSQQDTEQEHNRSSVGHRLHECKPHD